jgi:hypothetical protein
MSNEQLMEVIAKIHALIHPDTTPTIDDDGEEVSDGAILDRIYAIVDPIVNV